MSNNNQNKPGYKHTSLGWIPEDWVITKLGKLVKLISGLHLDPNEYNRIGNGTPYFTGPTDYTNCCNQLTKWTVRKAAIAKENDVLITVKGSGVGSMHYLRLPEVAIGRQIMAIRDEEHFSTSFIYHYLLQKEYQFQELAKGNMIPGLTRDDILSLEIKTPSVPERLKIATILSTWDEAIISTQELISQLQLRNKCLLQQLLSGKKRLQGFDADWKGVHLGDVLIERNETGFINLNLLSVGSLGIYPQSQSEKRDISNMDKSKYKRICPGDIGYNTMRMWQGRSALSSLEGIISPAYTVVTPKEQQHSLFYAYLFKLPSVVNKFFRNSQGLVEDTLNCKFKDLAIVKVEVPEYDEQVAIAEVISKSFKQVKIYEEKLAALQQQKKGLMQKLLTGEVRVKV